MAKMLTKAQMEHMLEVRESNVIHLNDRLKAYNTDIPSVVDRAFNEGMIYALKLILRKT